MPAISGPTLSLAHWQFSGKSMQLDSKQNLQQNFWTQHKLWKLDDSVIDKGKRVIYYNVGGDLKTFSTAAWSMTLSA